VKVRKISNLHSKYSKQQNTKENYFVLIVIMKHKLKKTGKRTWSISFLPWIIKWISKLFKILCLHKIVNLRNTLISWKSSLLQSKQYTKNTLLCRLVTKIIYQNRMIKEYQDYNYSYNRNNLKRVFLTTLASKFKGNFKQFLNLS